MARFTLPPEIPYNRFKRYTAAEWRAHCEEFKKSTTPEERMLRMMPGVKWVMVGGKWVPQEQAATA